MRLGETTSIVFVLLSFTWLPAGSFNRMHSTFGRRCIFSTAVKAVSAFNAGRNVLFQQFPFAFGAKSPDRNYEYLARQHARLFGVSTSASASAYTGIMDGDEHASKHSDYEKWVRRLYMTNLFHPVKMGLANMNQLHDIMGKPMDDVRIFQYLWCQKGSVVLFGDDQISI